MSCEYHFIEKTAQHSQKNIFKRFLPGVFYQMLNKRSKQLSLLHLLIGKLDQTGFPHPSMAT